MRADSAPPRSQATSRSPTLLGLNSITIKITISVLGFDCPGQKWVTLLFKELTQTQEGSIDLYQNQEADHFKIVQQHFHLKLLVGNDVDSH